MFRAREVIYELLEACCGARLTVSYVRIGGLAQDVPDDFEARCRKAISIPKRSGGCAMPRACCPTSAGAPTRTIAASRALT